MIFKNKILRETILMVTISAFFGFSYTYITQKGFFHPNDKNFTFQPDNFEIIFLETVKNHFLAGDAIFIDSRHEYDYSLGHIKNSINIALNDFDVHIRRLESTPKNKLLIIYCDGEECNSSIAVSEKLLKSGFTNVKVFFGGWQEWKNAGLPIEK